MIAGTSFLTRISIRNFEVISPIDYVIIENDNVFQ